MPKELTLDEQIDEALNNPAAEDPAPDEEELVEETDDKPEEEKPEEVVVSEETKPAPVVETPKIDPEMAFHLREEKRRRQEVEAELAALKAPKPVETPKAVAPDPNEDPIGYVAFKQAELAEKQDKIDRYIQQQENARQTTQRYEAAKNELGGYIQQFASKTQDFQPVAIHLEQQLSALIRAENPGITAHEVTEMVDKKVLLMASKAVNAGIDPASYLYEQGKAMGYKAKEPEVKIDPTKKPDLKVVEKNRKKSANGLSGGSGKTGVSIKDLENMSIAEMEEDEEASALMGFNR